MDTNELANFIRKQKVAFLSSVDEAATAVTTTTETTSEPSVSETPETTESHRIAMESK